MWQRILETAFLLFIGGRGWVFFIVILLLCLFLQHLSVRMFELGIFLSLCQSTARICQNTQKRSGVTVP